jgi:hypothetical protein
VIIGRSRIEKAQFICARRATHGRAEAASTQGAVAGSPVYGGRELILPQYLRLTLGDPSCDRCPVHSTEESQAASRNSRWSSLAALPAPDADNAPVTFIGRRVAPHALPAITMTLSMDMGET